MDRPSNLRTAVRLRRTGEPIYVQPAQVGAQRSSATTFGQMLPPAHGRGCNICQDVGRGGGPASHQATGSQRGSAATQTYYQVKGIAGTATKAFPCCSRVDLYAGILAGPGAHSLQAAPAPARPKQFDSALNRIA